MKHYLTVLLIVLTVYVSAQNQRFTLGMHAGVNYGKLIDKDFKIKKREPGYLINIHGGYNVNGCTGFAFEAGYEKKNSKYGGSEERLHLNYYNFRALFSGCLALGGGLMNVTFGGFYNQLDRGNSIISKDDYGLSFSLEPGSLIHKKVFLGVRFRYEKGFKNIYAPEPKIRDLRSSYFSVCGGITWFL